VIDEKRVLKASWWNPASKKVKNSSHAKLYSPVLEDPRMGKMAIREAVCTFIKMKAKI